MRSFIMNYFYSPFRFIVFKFIATKISTTFFLAEPSAKARLRWGMGDVFRRFGRCF